MFVFKTILIFSIGFWNLSTRGQLIIPRSPIQGATDCKYVPGFCVQYHSPTFIRGPKIVRSFGIMLPEVGELKALLGEVHLQTLGNHSSRVPSQMKELVDAMVIETEEYKASLDCVIPEHARINNTIRARRSITAIILIALGAAVSATFVAASYGYASTYKTDIAAISKSFKELTQSVNENLKKVSGAMREIVEITTQLQSLVQENTKNINLLSDTMTLIGLYKTRMAKSIRGLKSLQQREIPYDFISVQGWNRIIESVEQEIGKYPGVDSMSKKMSTIANFDAAWMENGVLFIGISFFTYIPNPLIHSFRLTTIPFKFSKGEDFFHIPQMKTQFILAAGDSGHGSKFRPTQISPVLIDNGRTTLMDFHEFFYPSMFHLLYGCPFLSITYNPRSFRVNPNANHATKHTTRVGGPEIQII